MDNYEVLNKIILFISELDDEVNKKLKNFKFGYTQPKLENLDREEEVFLIYFNIVILTKDDQIITSYPVTVLINNQNQKYGLKFNEADFVYSDYEFNTDKFKTFNDILKFIKINIEELIKQLRIIEAFNIYFKKDIDDFYIDRDYYDGELFLDGFVLKKFKKIEEKHYIAKMFLKIDPIFKKITIKKKIYKKRNSADYDLTEIPIISENYLKEIAEIWKLSLIDIKNQINTLESKYKRQKFKLRKL